MPRTTKGTDGGKRHPLNMRTTKETRERLEASAVANGRSLAQEVEFRLERSFAEEVAFGGPEMHRLAILMVSAFVTAGQRRGASNPDWIRDPACYLAGARGVAHALLLGLPHGATSETVVQEMEAWKGVFLSEIANREQDQ
jgi:hypothetical protein